MLKTIQIEIKDSADENAELVKVLGKRPLRGWFTVYYNGVRLDKSTICDAKRNPGGQFIS